MHKSYCNPGCQPRGKSELRQKNAVGMRHIRLEREFKIQNVQ